MADPLALLRLLQVSDSGFPSGAFAFSSGLEALDRDGFVSGAGDVAALLSGHIVPRWLGFDRVFLARAHGCAGDPEATRAVDLECHRFNTVERLADASRRVGRALLMVHARMGTPGAAAYRAALAAPPEGAGPAPHPPLAHDCVVQGLLAPGLGLSLEEAEAGALHAMVMAFLTAAVRLGRLGAIEAQIVLRAAGPAMAAGLARPAPHLPGSFAPFSDIAALRRSPGQAALFAT